MPKDNKKDYELRIKVLEKEVDLLKTVLGQMAVGFDKLSQVQANQTDVMESLIQAKNKELPLLKGLIDTGETTKKMLSQLLKKSSEKK